MSKIRGIPIADVNPKASTNARRRAAGCGMSPALAIYLTIGRSGAVIGTVAIIGFWPVMLGAIVTWTFQELRRGDFK